MSARSTPLMQQFYAAKRAYPGSILFFRMGDFYEMFEEDAVIAARALDLTLTSRNKGKPDEIPMAGVPHHAAHGYVARLLEQGYRVAICEQMADPSKVKGIVPRQVVRVLTPGTVTDREQLDASRNNWLAALELGEGRVGIALLDLSTAELSCAELTDLTALLGELSRAAPRELVLGPAEGAPEEQLTAARAALTEVLPGAAQREDTALSAEEVTLRLEGVAADAAGLGELAARACARALRFAAACNPERSLPVRRVSSWDPRGHLVIDAIAQRHLELVESMSGDSKGTLLAVIDLTRTPLGARLLRRRLLAPLLELGPIRRRLDQVELFVASPRLRRELAELLSGVGDLERLTTRAELAEATPRDLGALRDGLVAAKGALELLHAETNSAARVTLGIDNAPEGSRLVPALGALTETLCRALTERPPAQAKDGAVFRPEYDEELARLDDLKHSGADAITALEARLREELGLPKLRVRYTRVFGWYVEVGRSQARQVPEAWRRKQTVASGERYTLPELDDLADAIANAEDLHRERELALLAELTAHAASQADPIRELARRVAAWDVASSLAEVAHRYDYGRPEVVDAPEIAIEDGRHPVVERLAAAGRFVPNDVTLHAEGERLMIVTGPNMAGKSTLLRQVALITILAQMGSFVPARSARVGLTDRVHSRVGASDNLARGESTFMVEMRETAEILRSATARSLVILDEIGRGTSTFDGLAIAWAVAEHLDEAVRCRALFATHYHELTALGEASPHVVNFSVSARELDGDVVFLHRLVPGPASQSYGVQVAKLAGLPESVLARARGLLEGFEGSARFVDERAVNGRPPDGSAASERALEEPSPRPRRRAPAPRVPQLDLFGAPAPQPIGDEVLSTLRHVDVNRLTPLAALELLVRLKKKL
ncbi:MAG: DNA mismatch repair protein MutS [Polyangiaceae bacterium]|nr:DNA mismatch repair protein MutS [Polyangiaceae bacterium]MCW5790718.1 DNA mismatch repair protein MutS [Polyangiaceae bacterium]